MKRTRSIMKLDIFPSWNAYLDLNLWPHEGIGAHDAQMHLSAHLMRDIGLGWR